MAVFAGLAVWAIVSNHFSPQQVQFGAIIAATVGTVVAFGVWLFEPPSWHMSGLRISEDKARNRLRQAEQQLAESLKQGSQAVLEAPTRPEQRTEQAKQERLTLPALWEVTHSRLDLYHEIATGQARRSFLTAQVAIAAGFVLLIVFAVLAAGTHTTAGAITTAALGAVSAALAGYISRTFVRSQESAAAHLRAYFDQPLEFSKYLAAERLLATNADLDGDKQAAILTALVQAIVVPSPPASATASRPRKRGAAQ
jgi:hypothetical protein